MNVASKELCERLFKLSGWGGTEKQWSDWHYGVLKFNEPKELFKGTYRAVTTSPYQDDTVFPAYDLGYLLRKIPKTFDDYHFDLSTSDGKWHTAYFTNDYTPERPDWKHNCEADTPEDAVCKLAIELIEKGILKP